ncbi:receptor-type guanylate cyclase Gyc76C-like [Sitodiplosis mosellana]|uniref:receptor-type guanylate cyclase Gyc76C-like n=1 Tax=Sitodiplosis mosellana TaxID=263140 RepID=UPI002444B979|nr:receptor-type guanylate cyclase Gyc76C-like [Sitodiplosis mosellana]XP_055316759.1 receptor-type guanylate cyclase Gyc76C-like [Sitodiplosis mosellana]XP_055316760.1 receptor-type guanylate cyclase Gyc76C-like [Sitodiplosis mosellana]XP_055316761.1 receptor-type guanylate cyclase Gyc76C-like [Sitodiplosis mosellana]XP_055316762.1 receptor-type guanylate cyclase Gyc76C-like [Sitodiplosis mosellana]XP_055316764.1 receptor-type guanylate cyclase Gyc76C-like [Sitodiplosis mosellana]XP_05531676
MTRWRFKLLLLVLIGIVITVFFIHPSHGARNHSPQSNNNYKKTVLTVGYLTAIKGELKDKQGLAISGALKMALDEVNNDRSLLPNVTLSLRWNDTRGDTVLATRAITEMICDGVATIFGPEGACHVEAIVSQSRNIPMISYKCSDYKASSIPTFARTEPPDTQVTKSVISLLHYYGWKKFSIIHEEVWTTVANSLKEQAKSKNMTINHCEKVIDNHKCCENNLACCRSSYWHQLIQNTKNGTRIYVFLGTATALNDMMVSMDTMQLFSKGEYMVIFVDMMTYSPREAHRYLFKPDQLTKLQRCNEIDNFAKRGRSLLVVVATPPTENYEKFTEKVREYNTKAPFNFTLPVLFNNYTKFVSIYAAYLYDSVKLYAWALDKLLKQEQEERPLTDKLIQEVAENGTRIIETIIKNRTYKSVTGSTIKIDHNGDSEGNFSVVALKPHKMARENFSCDLHMVPVAYFQQGEDFPEYRLINASWRIDWPGSEKPIDEPICGFNNELCPKDDTHITSMVIAGALALMLFCSTVVMLSIYRKWKIELEIEGLLWKIDSSEIKGYFNNDIVSSPSKLSLVSAASFGSRCSNQVFTTTGKFRGVVVRIKELKFARKRDISRDIMKEMRLLRDLRHDNINSFIGACVEPMRILLVTDYCAKGSLYDIIENEDIKLDDLFIASLIHDLIKGMIYIHDSALNFHGNLKSSNCVVTSRWLLQVTDFGLHDLRHCAENESIGEHQYYRNQFWKAPEILRNSNVYGSQKADTYAFAIILYEVIGRKGPFGQVGYEPKEIIEMVKHVPSFNEDPFRPDIECIQDCGNCADYIVNCIKECWDENPEVRPDFPTIRSRLKKMRGGKSKNIMDQMMEMMEKYANNLEDIVNERTRLLCEEKKKTEDLLHRMLPKTVAANLTKGHGVEPVSYSSVTIYFSDIVGFTAMSAESSPLQVVNFLNDLYTVFDRIIKGYDVYKVETIGDAYMVVSGLPIKNDIRHVGEIASMSLDLLSAVLQHKISHRPNEMLKLRIGMHTGPVVAGVVGLTMPRYCLFGDTVNTASRMESTGEALKIHISVQVKEMLERLGGYETEERGQIELKGKGKVTTYWLTGANDKAIKRREVNLSDLPPLFCRPRRSPKLNCDSRQPSYVGAQYFGNNNANCGTNSRRQSNVPRNDSESASSLQGSLKRVVEYSPKSSQRKHLNRTPLYLSENSRITQTESLTNTDCFFKPDDESINQYQLQQLDYVQKKPFAMVRPRRIVINDEYRSFLSQLDLNYNVAARLRESKSLDLIPCNQLRNRVDSKRLPIAKINDRSACSLDAGVSMISRDPMPEPFNLGNTRCNFEIGSNRMICAPEHTTDTITNKLTKKSKSPYKGLNNCNGPTSVGEDAHCPLLYRQNSLNNPQDENVLQHKRWRSLETVQHNRSDSDTSVSKNVKNMNRGSIRSWLVNLFHGNGFNDASLRKAGVVQNRVKGYSGFGELPPAPEHESIV